MNWKEKIGKKFAIGDFVRLKAYNFHDDYEDHEGLTAIIVEEVGPGMGRCNNTSGRFRWEIEWDDGVLSLAAEENMEKVLE